MRHAIHRNHLGTVAFLHFLYPPLSLKGGIKGGGGVYRGVGERSIKGEDGWVGGV